MCQWGTNAASTVGHSTSQTSEMSPHRKPCFADVQRSKIRSPEGTKIEILIEPAMHPSNQISPLHKNMAARLRIAISQTLRF